MMTAGVAGVKLPREEFLDLLLLVRKSCRTGEKFPRI
jgi:hypothetical protein